MNKFLSKNCSTYFQRLHLCLYLLGQKQCCFDDWRNVHVKYTRFARSSHQKSVHFYMADDSWTCVYVALVTWISSIHVWCLMWHQSKSQTTNASSETLVLCPEITDGATETASKWSASANKRISLKLFYNQNKIKSKTINKSVFSGKQLQA